MDPFSITVGVVSLVSSLYTISLKLNDLRMDFSEARTEIDEMLKELNDLSGILNRLQNTGNTSRLPANLNKDLAGVLTNCNNSAVEAEILLRKAAAKRMRGMHWSFTGKKECLQLCRRLGAHKATMSITFNLCSIEVTQEILGKTDQISRQIRVTRTQLTAKDEILERYLNDATTYAETVIELSTTKDADDGRGSRPRSNSIDVNARKAHVPDTRSREQIELDRQKAAVRQVRIKDLRAEVKRLYSERARVDEEFDNGLRVAQANLRSAADHRRKLVCMAEETRDHENDKMIRALNKIDVESTNKQKECEKQIKARSSDAAYERQCILTAFLAVDYNASKSHVQEEQMYDLSRRQRESLREEIKQIEINLCQDIENIMTRFKPALDQGEQQRKALQESMAQTDRRQQFMIRELDLKSQREEVEIKKRIYKLKDTFGIERGRIQTEIEKKRKELKGLEGIDAKTNEK